MDQKLNRRQVIRTTAAGALAVSAGSAFVTSGVMAQDSSPEASPSEAQDPVYSATEGPEEGQLTVTHAQGETVVSVNPETVISYDITSVDTLQALGVQLAGMPEITAPEGRISTEGIEVVGSLFEPDYEKVNEMQPDLIIVGGRSSEVYGDLSDLAPTIDLTFQRDDFVSGLDANSRLLGEIFGKSDEVDAELENVHTRVADIQEMARGINSGLVVMVTGGGVTALAPETARAGRGALIYQTMGINPPLEDLEEATHGEPISFEFLLEHDPEWLFVIDRDAATGTEDAEAAEQVLDNDIMHQTSAWQNDRIVYLDPFDWYIISGAGLNSIQRMLDELEAAFSE